jgi:23S rRNA (cytidine1920-2'-O)/16S rRNA (cytidine1409-2'-O)-methyltransferase
MPGIRLDRLLADRGLAPSRERAQALVMAGRVVVDGKRVDKAGARIAQAAEVEVLPDPNPFVSRGGLKLAAALEKFGIRPVGWRVLDVGASTGGFTDCLLKAGAGCVIALDVGHGQLDWTLRNDPRVVVVERFNARHLSPAALEAATGGRAFPVDLAVVDVSFISVGLILPALASLPDLPRVVCLVKPQFEAGKGSVGKGGIIRDAQIHSDVLKKVDREAGATGWTTCGVIASPIRGAEGNREFFLDLHRGPPATVAPGFSLTARLDAVLGDHS